MIGVGPGAASSNSGSSTSGSPSGTTSSGVQTPGTSGNTGTSASNVSYADAIMSAAQSSGVSPYVIAAMIIQEQGRNGTGNSISGNYAGYTGYYNYFNVGAYASDGMGAVQRGTHLRAAAMADRGQHRKALSQAVPSSTAPTM